MMKKKLGILLIHGSGAAHYKLLDKFILNLKKSIHQASGKAEEVEIIAANWHPAVQTYQENLWARLDTPEHGLKCKALRKFVLYTISDNVAYSGYPDQYNTAYGAIHHIIHEYVVRLKDMLEEDAPLMIIASSLGTVIISNYIWDRQHPEGEDPLGASAFERMETLAGLYTFGNNMPIYLGSYDIDQLVAIQFPSLAMPEQLKPLARWENIYSKQDAMGYPLRTINDTYFKSVTADIQMNIGGLLTFWNTASHVRYWSSRKIQQRIAAHVKDILEQYHLPVLA